MAKKDIHGRRYVLTSQLHEGLLVEVDGGFTCMTGGAKKVVMKDDGGFYIHCFGPEDARRPTEHHYLDGQDDGMGRLTGIYLA